MEMNGGSALPRSLHFGQLFTSASWLSPNSHQQRAKDHEREAARLLERKGLCTDFPRRAVESVGEGGKWDHSDQDSKRSAILRPPMTNPLPSPYARHDLPWVVSFGLQTHAVKIFAVYASLADPKVGTNFCSLWALFGRLSASILAPTAVIFKQ